MRANESNYFGDTVQGYGLPGRDEGLVAGDKYDKHLLICTAEGGCGNKGGFDVKQAFWGTKVDNELDRVKLSAVRGLGFCDRGPVAVVYPEGVWYDELTVDDVPNIVNEHLKKGNPVQDLTFDPELPDDFKLFVMCTFLSACGPEGGGKALGYFKKKARDRDNIKVVQSYGCLKECSMGPVGCMYPSGTWYANLHEFAFDDIWETEFLKNEPSMYQTGGIGTDSD